jgi:hypothetical protein
MALNPDRNLYAVGDVGPNVIIANSAALKGGISRERALNLATWLIIATRATPEELRAELAKASTPVVRGAAVAPTPQPPVSLPAPPTSVNGEAAAQTVLTPEIVETARATMGDLDANEKAAIEAAAREAMTSVGAGKVNGIKPASTEELASSWGI